MLVMDIEGTYQGKPLKQTLLVKLGEVFRPGRGWVIRSWVIRDTDTQPEPSYASR